MAPCWKFPGGPVIRTLCSHGLEKAMALHSSTLAWKIPWMEEPGGLQSMGSLGVGHNWATSLFTFHFHALEKEMATHSSVLAWRIPGTGEPGGLPSMGSHRTRHDWSDLAAVAAAAVPHRWAAQVISQRQSIMYDYNNKSGKMRVKITEADPA